MDTATTIEPALEITTLPDATILIHQAVSVLLNEELPGAGSNPEIMAGFAMLTERVIDAIDVVREEELTLLREMVQAVLVSRAVQPNGKVLRFATVWESKYGS